MSRLEPYQGTNVNATSAETLLDYRHIRFSCADLMEKVSTLKDYANRIRTSGSVLSGDNFSIDDVGAIPQVEDYCSSLESVADELKAVLEQILQALDDGYNKLQEKLNTEAQIQDQNYQTQ